MSSQNAPLAIYELGPSEVLDYAIDWSDWLPAGDSIVGTPTITQSDGDGNLTINPSGKATTVAGAVVGWWLGTPGVGINYNVHVAIVTAQGRTSSRFIQINGVNR